ncbi:MAG: hypothetical protein QOF01_2964, partial [Thermomicrobiales bacterium]|nr:hypothetical protein [Thermomicrobiales bacterium]
MADERRVSPATSASTDDAADQMGRVLATNSDRRRLLRAAGGLGAAALVGIPGLGGGAASAGSASRLAALRAVLQEGQPGGTLIACIPFDLWSIYNPLIGQSDNFVFD